MREAGRVEFRSIIGEKRSPTISIPSVKGQYQTATNHVSHPAVLLFLLEVHNLSQSSDQDHPKPEPFD